MIFAAGNSGRTEDGNDRRECTVYSPATAKNTLAVGATSSGETRLRTTDADGGGAQGTDGDSDIDTIAAFSSFGPTLDNRIKPEVVAPGDMVGFSVFCSLASFYLGSTVVCEINQKSVFGTIVQQRGRTCALRSESPNQGTFMEAS